MINMTFIRIVYVHKKGTDWIPTHIFKHVYVKKEKIFWVVPNLSNFLGVRANSKVRESICLQTDRHSQTDTRNIVKANKPNDIKYDVEMKYKVVALKKNNIKKLRPSIIQSPT